MKEIIVSKQDVGEFLFYCVSWDIQATVINNKYQFLGRPLKFIFKLNKSLEEIDYVNIKRMVPSFEFYT
jgi:hypothetical protein